MLKLLKPRFTETLLCSFLLTGPCFAETPADNSQRNSELNKTINGTADQQGNDETSVTITRNIRKAIVADKSLSTYAHNIKIISKGKRVALKGPVTSQEEKAKVEKLASKAAPEAAITSEIEIVSK